MNKKNDTETGCRPETTFTAERISRMRKLWKDAYENIVPTMIEENCSISQVAVIFFELGFRAADENPPEKRKDPDSR